jgi:glycosyltransferase involved in cell wall biosynthesis
MEREKNPRVAIVHDWLTGMRGGEKCIEAMLEVFEDVDVFTLIHLPGSVSRTIERAVKQTTFVQRLPGAKTRFRRYLPLFPAAIRRLDLRGYDLVISSHHCVAKGARVPEGVLHICYCYTPMRYLWYKYDDYFGPGRAGLFTRTSMRLVVGPLRRWDLATASNPHFYVATCNNVAHRVRDIYGRDADVIYPPVDTSRFTVSHEDGTYYLMVGALVRYKRFDIAIEAFNRAGEKLVIVGDGPEAAALRGMARSNIRFEGWRSDDELRNYYAGCRALIFPGEEDFGIVPLEAMSTGKPVLAYARGGALETVVVTPGLRTGTLFTDQTVEGLLAGLEELKITQFDPLAIRQHALGFDREIYKSRIKEFCLSHWGTFGIDSSEPHMHEQVIGSIR